MHTTVPRPKGLVARIFQRLAPPCREDEPSVHEWVLALLAEAGFVYGCSFRTEEPDHCHGEAATVFIMGDVALEKLMTLAVDALHGYRVVRLDERTLAVSPIEVEGVEVPPPAPARQHGGLLLHHGVGATAPDAQPVTIVTG